MKVLIISHNCFSSTQNMGKTLSSLFSQFDKSELMQLYLYPSLPNVDICNNYFRVTDNDVIKSFFFRWKCGRTINPSEIKEENSLFSNQIESKQYETINRNSLIVRRLRDFVWCLGNWKTIELKNWLRSNNPDVVFYALGDALFSQKIAIWAANYLNIPLVTYVCDEFCFSTQNARGVRKWLSSLVVKGIKKVLNKSAICISICDELGELYKQVFNIPFITIMTGSSIDRGVIESSKDSKEISYIGNVALNRWKSLIDISMAINDINKKLNSNYELTYYGNECNELKHVEGIRYGGRLDANQVYKKIASSCLLIHTETFEEDYRDRLRYSVSTKIADCLASGTPLLAYGPGDIASMQHLARNKCAFVVTDTSSLSDVLIDALTNQSKREEITKNAICTATARHNMLAGSEKLKTSLKDVIISQDQK